MAPGIMILAASEPPPKLGVHGSVPGSPDIEPKQRRPDSPGGYFTLSDSDGASGTGTEPSLEPEESPRVVHMYKIFRSPASKALSESPPRIIPSASSKTSDSSSQRSRS